MSMEPADADSARNARILRLVMAHVEDECLPLRNVESVLELVGADPHERNDVFAALAERSIRVLDDPPTAASDDVAPVPLAAHDLQTAADVGRRLLHGDRRDAAPWRRLLTAQEELGLALLCRGGRMPLSVELPRGYRSGLHDADERAAAFDAFVLHNLRLVHSIANGWPTTAAMDADDLAQSGMVGLLRAVEKFDATRALKFSTYATWWIRQAITRALADDGPVIRIPVHMTEKIHKVAAARSRLLDDGGSATLAQLAAVTGYDPDTVRQCLDLSRGVISLDTPLSDPDGATMADVLYAPPGAGFDPEEVLDTEQVRMIVTRGLAGLPEREARVLRLRAGLVNDEPLTLDAIGAQLGVSRERVRQIEGKAKKKLAPILADLGLRPTTPSTVSRPADEPDDAA